MSARTSTVRTTFGDLTIHGLPAGKPVAVKKVIRIDNKTVFLGDDGKIYCPSVHPGCFYGIGDFKFTTTLMNGLVKLGVATREQVREHLQIVAKRDAATAAEFALERITEIAKEHGLKIPATELNKLKRAARQRPKA